MGGTEDGNSFVSGKIREIGKSETCKCVFHFHKTYYMSKLRIEFGDQYAWRSLVRTCYINMSFESEISDQAIEPTL